MTTSLWSSIYYRKKKLDHNLSILDFRRANPISKAGACVSAAIQSSSGWGAFIYRHMGMHLLLPPLKPTCMRFPFVHPFVNLKLSVTQPLKDTDTAPESFQKLPSNWQFLTCYNKKDFTSHNERSATVFKWSKCNSCCKQKTCIVLWVGCKDLSLAPLI